MDPRFRPHNRHLDSVDAFMRFDPHLERLRSQPLVHHFPLQDRLPDEPGIYSVTGGRQIGKSTILKQKMAALVRSGIPAGQAAYFAGELIDDHHTLVRHLGDFIEEHTDTDRLHIMLDEITYCRDWDRGVKYLADAGRLRNVVLVLTGSDSVVIRDARVRLPGRRGREGQVDFHLFPLQLSEVVELRDAALFAELGRKEEDFPCPDAVRGLFEAFELYLRHGGYLTAINDIARAGVVLPATFATYSDWIRGDVLKRGKQEHYLNEIFEAVFKHYGSQVTWNGLARELSIDHPATVGDYLALLQRMDAVVIHAALREDRLAAAPKKARKVFFADPFILHAVRAWLHPATDPFTEQVQPMLSDPMWAGRLAEACAAAHYHRLYPTYYIKAEGEVDIAYVKDSRFWPVEVKWTGQVRPKDIKQIAKYPNGLICGRGTEATSVRGIPVEPLPLHQFRLGPSPTSLQA